MINLCIECNRSGGRHATGCPEDVDYSDDVLLTCRCCGIDKECIVERAGPICAECAPLPAQ